MLLNNLPVFALNIDDSLETGCFKVSLVDAPAVEKAFLAFDEDKPKVQKFAVTDEEKHIVTGVAMRANQPIYRCDEAGHEFYVLFTKESIVKMVQKYAREGFQHSVSVQHAVDVNGCYVFESYIVDKSRGICPLEFSDIEDGSWMISMKVDNSQVWDLIKSGEFKGFSIEVAAIPEAFKAYVKQEKEKEKAELNKLMDLFR